jgi:hypothetical protein
MQGTNKGHEILGALPEADWSHGLWSGSERRDIWIFCEDYSRVRSTRDTRRISTGIMSRIPQN